MTASEPFLGVIFQGGWNFAPRGFALCNGQLVSIAQNNALFALLGTTFGGDGVNTFALPNLQSRSMMHWGTGPGLSTVQLGEQGGAEQTTLTVNQLPSHTHTATFTPTLNATTTKATLQTPTDGAVLGKTVDNSGGTTIPAIYAPAGTSATVPLGGLNLAGSVTNGIAGNSQPVPISSPYLAVTHVIAMEGIFPSRS